MVINGAKSKDFATVMTGTGKHERSPISKRLFSTLKILLKRFQHVCILKDLSCICRILYLVVFKTSTTAILFIFPKLFRFSVKATLRATP